MGKQYLLVSDAMSWGSAPEAYCAARGMALAGLASEEQAVGLNAEMMNLIQDTTEYYWIGGLDCIQSQMH